MAAEQLVDAVEAAGYHAVLPTERAGPEREQHDESALLRRRLIISAALIIAGAAAYPINRWLISRGKGHAVVHEHHAH